MAESQQEIEDMKRSWQEKLLQAQASGVRKQLTALLSTKVAKKRCKENRSIIYRCALHGG